jgi:predicted Zn-dependent protease with MMP-like domain
MARLVLATIDRSVTLPAMSRSFGPPPDLHEIDQLARAALTRIGQPFASHLASVRLVVEDFADEETLADLGIEDPFELTGVYEGLPVGVRSIDHSGTMPDRIRLFRRPILDEWAENGNVTLEQLVAHVLVHEVGHHFGLSDDDMHALEDAAN